MDIGQGDVEERRRMDIGPGRCRIMEREWILDREM